jgi:hypothetical protein
MCVPSTVLYYLPVVAQPGYFESLRSPIPNIIWPPFVSTAAAQGGVLIIGYELMRKLFGGDKKVSVSPQMRKPCQSMCSRSLRPALKAAFNA